MEKIKKILNKIIIISLVAIPILLFISFYNLLVGRYYVKVNNDNKTDIYDMLKENDVQISGELSKIGYHQNLGQWELYLIYDNFDIQDEWFGDGDASDLYTYIKNYGKNLATYLNIIIELLIKCIFICLILKIIFKLNKNINTKNVHYVFFIVIVILVFFIVFNNIRENIEIKKVFEESAWVKVSLKPETTQEEINNLIKEIEKMPYFRTVKFESKEDIFDGYGDIDNYRDGIKMECYCLKDNNGKFDDFAYFKNIEKELKKYDCIESVGNHSLLDLYKAGGMNRVNKFKEKVKKIEEREKEEQNSYNTINNEVQMESNNEVANKIENNISYANHYDLTVFSNYYGKNISYTKTVDLLNKFCNEYYIYLVNSESMTGNNPGIYVYLSRNTTADKMLKDSIVSTIKSTLKVLEESVEATYNISYGMDKKYGEYIFIERNDLRMLRGNFKIISKTDNNKNNADYIEDFNMIFNSKEFIENINNNYNIDITNNVKLWSMEKNNFLMNIGCENIDKNKYKEYSEYVFKTFKTFVKNKYNLELELTTDFNEVIQ